MIWLNKLFPNKEEGLDKLAINKDRVISLKDHLRVTLRFRRTIWKLYGMEW